MEESKTYKSHIYSFDEYKEYNNLELDVSVAERIYSAAVTDLDRIEEELSKCRSADEFFKLVLIANKCDNNVENAKKMVNEARDKCNEARIKWHRRVVDYRKSLRKDEE